MSILIYATAVLFLSMNCIASIYKCYSPSNDPKKVQNSIKTELSITHMPSYITSNELNVLNLDRKKPFLIYFAIDSYESFMQISVQYEISKLQQKCRENSNVEFVAFLNSLFVNERKFIVCKNRLPRKINLSDFPDLNQRLSRKLSYIANIGDGSKQKNPLLFKTKSNKEIKRAFKNYPLAHPDFLHDLIQFATTDKELFPNEKHAAFIHLKSHGSREHVLAGLHSCQERAKVLNSSQLTQKLLTIDEQNTLQNLNSINKIEKNLQTYERIISKLDLGPTPGIGNFNNDPKLGEDRLGEDRLSDRNLKISSAIQSLGANEGLGSNLSFGTNQKNLGLILDKLFKSGSNRSLGFLILESCDSNRNPSIFHTNLANIFGYYSSKQSLWYRNLNWWKILEDSKGVTVNLVNILQDVTFKIPNIEMIEVN